jgi:hypothetical protein
MLMKLGFSRQIFEQSSSITFHKNPSSWGQVVLDRWTDKAELIPTFRNVANAPKKTEGKKNYIDLKHDLTLGLLITCTRAKGLKIRGSNSGRGADSYFFHKTPKPFLGPTHPAIQRVPKFLVTGEKRPGHKGKNSTPSIADVKNGWSYSSIVIFLNSPEYKPEAL